MTPDARSGPQLSPLLVSVVRFCAIAVKLITPDRLALLSLNYLLTDRLCGPSIDGRRALRLMAL